MNLIDQTFSRLKEARETALIPFLTIGDPDVETSVEIIAQLEAAGADIVELGVPYSDPLADGPVIQRASQRALKHQVNIRSCMEAAVKARSAGVKLPFILFTYYNPVLQFGLDLFFDEVKKHDISGLIIPDLLSGGIGGTASPGGSRGDPCHPARGADLEGKNQEHRGGGQRVHLLRFFAGRDGGTVQFL